VKLYLVQHGEALPKTEDTERPLSEAGQRDVQAMAAFLEAAGIRVERVWHSGKRRAEQTADILARSVLPKGKAVAIQGINANDAVGEFSADADVWEEDTVVVGHLPFMSRLVSLLTHGDPEHAVVAYSPGSVVCLERLASHHWAMLWMQRPELLAGR